MSETTKSRSIGVKRKATTHQSHIQLHKQARITFGNMHNSNCQRHCTPPNTPETPNTRPKRNLHLICNNDAEAKTI